MNTFGLVRTFTQVILAVAFFVVLAIGTTVVAEEVPSAPLLPEEETVVEETIVEEETSIVEEAPVEEVTEALPLDETVVEEILEQALEEVTTGEPETPLVESSSAPAPELSTDKDDYHPGETATIFGKFFGSVKTIALHIFGYGSTGQDYTEEIQEVTTDEEGSFTTTYVLDNVFRPVYTVIASALDGASLAYTTFLDARLVTSATINGGASVSVAPGATIAAQVNVTTDGSGSAARWRSTGWRISASAGAMTCVNHGNHDGAGSNSESFNITAPVPAGIYNAYFIAYDNETCSGGASNTFTLTNGVTVTGVPLTPQTITVTTPAPATAVNGGTFNVAATASSGLGVAITTSGSCSGSGTNTALITMTSDTGTCTVNYNQAGNGTYSAAPQVSSNTAAQAVNALATIDQYSQCANDDGDGYSGNPGDCDWTNGNLNSSNSTYTESDATVQRLAIADLTPGNHTVTIQYDSLKGGKHAYDFITSDIFSEDWVNSADLCASPLTSFASCALAPAVYSSVIPTAPNTNTGAYNTDENAGSERKFAIRNGSWVSVGTPTVIGGADAPTNIQLTFTVPSNCLNKYQKQGIDVCEVLISFGAHISKEEDWGIGNSAVDIQGSPYHVRVVELDGGTVGSRDNQMAASAIVPLPGQIIIEKQTVPNGNGTQFNFNPSWSAQDFTLTDNAQHNSGDLVAGTYSVVESALAGWNQTSAVCSDGSAIDAISLQAGEVVTCVFTNTLQTGSLTVVKNTVGGNASFDFDATGAGLPADIDLTTVNETASQTFNNLSSLNTYTLLENAPNGWVQTNAVCDNGETVDSINIDPGQTVTCTFTNTKNGSITVAKETVGGNGDFDFSGDITATLSDGQSSTPVSVAPGTYTVDEASVPGWALTDITCSDANSSGVVGTGIATFNVAAGENVTCTYTNSKLPTLELRKTVTNDNGGGATTASFTPSIDGQPAITWNQVVTLEPGVYDADETSLAGYSTTGWTGACNAAGGVTLAYGDAAVCSIVNTDDAPSLTLVKVVENNNGGEAVESEFTLTATGPTGFSGAGPSVSNGASFDAGTYNLSESGPDGYDASDWVCVGGTQNDADTVTLGLGQSATCTITNDDIAPSLTLVKQVINLDGGDAVPADWTLTATGPTSISGAGGATSDATFDAGVYALSESTGPAGYTAGAWSCIGGTQNGASITLALAESATCTIINDDQSGKLKVTKMTDPVSDITTEFDITASADGEGEVQGSAARTIVGGQTVEYTVDQGVYDVSEADENGWVETENTCNDIVVPNGGEGSCTITNTKLGTVTIVKNGIPNDPQDFSFTNNFGNGHPAAFSLDDDSNGTLPNSRSFAVLPGTFAVAEDATPGWKFDSASCTDGSLVSAIGVSAGENVTCTFINKKLGAITLVKETVGGNGTFDFVMTGATLPVSAEATTVDGVSTQDFTGIDPDNSYGITETVPEGWDLTAASCVNENDVVDTTPASFEINNGGHVTCTFENTKRGSITVDKVTVGDDASFSFDASGGTLPEYGDFSLTGAATPNTQVLKPGAYSVTEGALPGWELANLTCNDANGSVNLGTRTATINLAPGEDVSCTFTNGKLPTLTLEKTVINLDGGDAKEEDFPAFIDATQVAWDAVTTLTPGEYVASETELPTYAAGDWDGDCAADGSVTLEYGDEKVCTIVNDDIAPTLKLVKHVTDDNGGNDEPSAWDLTATGDVDTFTDAGDSDTFHDVTAGIPYLLSEDGPTGYDASVWSCDGGELIGSTLELGLAEDVTCEITNDDIAPTITLIKALDVKYGGTAGIDDFGLTIGDLSVASGDTQTVLANEPYALDEEGLTGWEFVDITGDAKCPALLGGTVTLDEGEDVTCTITNKDLPGTISGHKFSDANANGVWDPEEDPLENWEINLDGVETGSVLTDEDGYYEFTELSQGEYTVSETQQIGWKQTAPEGGVFPVSLSNGEDVTDLDFGNVELGTITVEKVLVSKNQDSDDVEFSFDADYGDDFTLVSGASKASEYLVPGEYAVSEINIPDGFNLTGIVCNDSNGTVNLEDALASLTLEAGEDISCTFTNTEEAHIIVDKVTNPVGDDAVFDFTTTGDDFDGFSLADEDPMHDVVLAAGAYSVAETVETGWDLTNTVCVSSVGDDEEVDDLALDAGETITCTFTNTKRGHLIIEKTTYPAGDTTQFSILASGNVAIPAGGAGTITDALDKDYEVKPGTYSVTETVPQGWDQNSNTCTGIVVAAGETETCTITNTKRATVTIVKDAIPDDAQNFAFAGSFGAFTLDDDAGVQDAELPNEYSNTVTFSNVIPGAKTVTETQPNQYWKLKTATCVLTGTQTVVNSSLVGGTLSVNVAPGSAVTCTFVNEKIDPTRTQGFWQTHTAYTTGKFTQYFGVSGMTIGTAVRKTIVTKEQLFGAWYSNIAKLSNGKTQRSALDKARMQLLQQLVTAKLNCATFGCSASVQTMIANADIAYSGNSASAILASAALVDAYNNSGDSIAIGNVTKATPKDSQNLANKSFWDTP